MRFWNKISGGRATLLAALLTLGTAGGCGVYDVPDDEGGGGSGRPFGPFSFQLPEEGSTVTELFTLEVSGQGIARVVFTAGDADPANDTTSPFTIQVNPNAFKPGSIEVGITVDGFYGEQERRTVLVNVQRPRPPLEDMQQAISALQPAHWYEIPWSQLRDVEWVAPTVEEFRGNTSSIFFLSGGAFDTKRNRLIVWGGGGSCNCWRNEMYVFDMDTLLWERLNDPSPWPENGEGNAFDLLAHPDNAPVSRHSFSYFEYVPDPVDRLVVMGGVVEGSDGNSEILQDQNIYHFDFDTVEWSITSAKNPYAWLGAHASVDANNKVWFHGAGTDEKAYLFSYDPVTEVTETGAWWGGGYTLSQRSAIDTLRNRMVAIGSGSTTVWDLSDKDAPHTTLATSGDTEIENAKGAGFEYHAPSDRFVAWSSGSVVYTLNPETGVWTKHPTAGAVLPTAPESTGTYGRFRYCPEYDVFVVVNGIASNVFVYRLPEAP